LPQVSSLLLNKMSEWMKWHQNEGNAIMQFNHCRSFSFAVSPRIRINRSRSARHHRPSRRLNFDYDSRRLTYETINGESDWWSRNVPVAVATSQPKWTQQKLSKEYNKRIMGSLGNDALYTLMFYLLTYSLTICSPWCDSLRSCGVSSVSKPYWQVRTRLQKLWGNRRNIIAVK